MRKMSEDDGRVSVPVRNSPNCMSLPDPVPLVEVGRYSSLSAAREAALALAAKDLAYSIDRAGREWLVRVEPPVEEIARAELESFEEEQQARPAAPSQGPLEKVRTAPLFFVVWILSGFFLIQQIQGEAWTRAGAATSKGILHGEWWRTITALTLHGDLPHLVANLATGLLFAASLQPQFGTGLTWLLFILAGALGNLVNAWGYRGEAHASIGASTAVFGALGLLVGAELWARWSHPHTRSRWSLIVPIGAGLALLAFLGVGDEHKRIDIMAHLWGLLVGIPLGLLVAAARLREHLPRWAQWLAGVAALALPLIAWWWAMYAH